jgi:hypothetical protein
VAAVHDGVLDCAADAVPGVFDCLLGVHGVACFSVAVLLKTWEQRCGPQ